MPAPTTGGSGDLFRAIKTQWDALKTAGTIPSSVNGYYRDRKPTGASIGFPYVVLTDLGAVRETTTNTSEYWLHSFEFRVYHSTIEDCENVTAQVGNALDPALFTFADPTKGEAIRRKRMEESYREEAQNVYRGSIRYEFLRWKPKAA